jgi:hypothetical protein
VPDFGKDKREKEERVGYSTEGSRQNSVTLVYLQYLSQKYKYGLHITRLLINISHAPYLGAFQTLKATSCRNLSAGITRFPPCCAKMKTVIIYIVKH